MDREETVLKYGTRNASVRRETDGRFLYNVWDPRHGFIASGFRRTKEEAVEIAWKVLKSREV